MGSSGDMVGIHRPTPHHGLDSVRTVVGAPDSASGAPSLPLGERQDDYRQLTGAWEGERGSGALRRKDRRGNGLCQLGEPLMRLNPIQAAPAWKVAKAGDFSTYESHTSHILRF